LRTNYQDVINISIKLRTTFVEIKNSPNDNNISKMDKLLKKLDKKLREGVLIVDTKEETMNNIIGLINARN
jgi:hypothetical protein